MLSFFAVGFALAGLTAAAGPIIIHLLNRRRHRTVEWAAMDFLRRAMQRSRKMMELRHLILLFLRSACVALFGLALARPFFRGHSEELLLRYLLCGTALAAAILLALIGLVSGSRQRRVGTWTAASLLLLAGLWGGSRAVALAGEEREGLTNARQPVHAVLILDNSMSMAYETLSGTLLERGKAKAAEFIDRLPSESRISVIPLCETSGMFSLDAYRTRDDARNALARIETVDRAGSVRRAVELATAACAHVPELPSKRVVFLSDQQSSGWRGGPLKEELEKLPELQLVQLRDKTSDNLSISSFRLRDGIADIETPASFLVGVRNHGSAPVVGLQVSLAIEGTVVVTQNVDLEANQERELEFKTQLDVPTEPGRPAFLSATASLAAEGTGSDRLKNDNRRYLVVPVVAALPVVFVDQYGRQEDVAAGRIGETYRLRRLLAPHSRGASARRELIQIRHLGIEEVDAKRLEDARLTIIAGVADPKTAIPVLRQYVRQGGQLAILTGGEFDPRLWNARGWIDGAGILPAPLEPQLFGKSVDEYVAAGETERMTPFHLDFSTMQHDYFLIEQEPREFLEDFYRQWMFFKSAQVHVSDEITEKLVATEIARIDRERAFVLEAEQRAERFARQQGSPGTESASSRSVTSAKSLHFDTEADLRLQDADQLRAIRPRWLLWRNERAESQTAAIDKVSSEQEARRTVPRVLARFAENGLPFLTERRIGEGRVLFFSSGAYSNWNLLEGSKTILMFDRIFRSLIEETLPRRNFQSGDSIVLPAAREENLTYRITFPSGLDRPVSPEPTTGDQYGIAVRDSFLAGHYSVTTRRIGDNRASLGRMGPAAGQTVDNKDEGGGVSGEKLRQVTLAINAPVDESDLATLGPEEVRERTGGTVVRWIDADESISLEGAQIRGRELWKWCLMAAVACVACEMLVLAWPRWFEPRRASLPVAEAANSSVPLTSRQGGSSRRVSQRGAT